MLRTESTLESLSAQVAQLKLAVARLQPASTSSVFSPFDPAPQQISASPFLNPDAAKPSMSATDPGVANLTQQVSALSASVAQLQRLQQTHSQNNAARAPAQPLPAPSPLGAGPRHPPASGLGNGTLAGIGGLRPGIGRSFSSSVLAPGSNNSTPLAVASNFPAADPKRRSVGLYGGNELKAPLASPHVGNHASQHPEWPVQSPAGSAGSGMQTPLGGPSGLLITKWEHLNLKAELQRAINKYG